MPILPPTVYIVPKPGVLRYEYIIILNEWNKLILDETDFLFSRLNSIPNNLIV